MTPRTTLEVIERMIRHSEYLRQINSNQAHRSAQSQRAVSWITIAFGAVVTFIAFIGSERLRAQLGEVGWVIPQAGIDITMNVLVLAIVVLSIGALIVPFGERAVEHRNAIRRLTEFIGIQGDRVRAARAGEISLTSADALQVRSEYLLMVSPLPSTTDKQFFRARADFEKKKRTSPVRVAEEESSSRYFQELLRRDAQTMEILHAIEFVVDQELWLVGGAIRNLVWDDKHLAVKRSALNDVDVVYFDPANLDESGEAAIKEQLVARLPKVHWEVRNQARFSKKYLGEPGVSLREAVRSFPETASAIAVRLSSGTLEVMSPVGLEDLVSLIVRPTSEGMRDRVIERSDAKGWPDKWPKLHFDIS
jgi:uncharacterized protein